MINGTETYYVYFRVKTRAKETLLYETKVNLQISLLYKTNSFSCIVFEWFHLNSTTICYLLYSTFVIYLENKLEEYIPHWLSMIVPAVVGGF